MCPSTSMQKITVSRVLKAQTYEKLRYRELCDGTVALETRDNAKNRTRPRSPRRFPPPPKAARSPPLRSRRPSSNPLDDRSAVFASPQERPLGRPTPNRPRPVAPRRTGFSPLLRTSRPIPEDAHGALLTPAGTRQPFALGGAARQPPDTRKGPTVRGPFRKPAMSAKPTSRLPASCRSDHG